MMNPAIQTLMDLEGEDLTLMKAKILNAPAIRYLKQVASPRIQEFQAELEAAGSFRELSEWGMNLVRLASVSRFAESMFGNMGDEPPPDERLYRLAVEEIRDNENLDVDLLATIPPKPFQGLKLSENPDES